MGGGLGYCGESLFTQSSEDWSALCIATAAGRRSSTLAHETGGNSGIILDSDQPLLGADQAGLREQVCRCAGGGIQFSLSNATWRVIHYALATTGSSGST